MLTLFYLSHYSDKTASLSNLTSFSLLWLFTLFPLPITKASGYYLKGVKWKGLMGESLEVTSYLWNIINLGPSILFHFTFLIWRTVKICSVYCFMRVWVKGECFHWLYMQSLLTYLRVAQAAYTLETLSLRGLFSGLKPNLICIPRRVHRITVFFP